MNFIKRQIEKLGNFAFIKAVLLSKSGILVSMILAGVLASFGFAPFSSFVAIVAAFSILFLLIFNLNSKKAVFASVLIFFTAQNTITLSWLNFVMEDFGQIPLVLSFLIELCFAVYLALPYALSAALVHTLKRFNKTALTLCFIPIAFCIADFIVGYLFTGFPWMYVGNACIAGPFASYLPLIGVRGVNLMIYVFTAALALTATRRFLCLPVAGIVFLIGVLTMGIKFTQEVFTLNIAVVQGNIKPEVKWDPQNLMPTVSKYWHLTQPYIKENTAIIWSESAIPLFIEESEALLSDLNTVMHDKKALLITGIQHYDLIKRQSFNSITVLGDQEKFDISALQRYDKKHLVPFGEFVPFESLLRPLGSIFNFPMSGFTKGADKQDPFSVFPYKLMPVICYESIFPELIQTADNDAINGIVMVSNDSWFGPTRGPQEHLAIAQIRALELQKPIIRATNSGITSIINADGKIVSTLPENQDLVLEDKVVLTKGATPYSRFGNIPLLVLILVLAFIGFFLGKHKNTAQDTALQHLIRP